MIYQIFQKLNNIYFASLFVIICFIVFRIPFYFWTPIPEIGPDTFLYFNILEMFDHENYELIRFPAFGYPMFIYLFEFISNKLMSISLFQSLFQLFSCLFFLRSYYSVFRKNILFVAIIIVGYLTSNINLVYDNWIVPDSILSSLFILFISFLIKSIYDYKISNYIFLVLIFVLILSIRANGILLVPVVLFLSFFQFKQSKNKIELFRNLSVCLTFAIALSTINYISPLYKTFNLISFPEDPYKHNDKIIIENYKDSTWLKLIKFVPEGEMYNLNTKSNLFSDSTLSNYVNGAQRGIELFIDSNNTIQIINFNDSKHIWSDLNLDSYCLKKNTLIHELENFKILFKKKYKNKTLKIVPEYSLIQKVILSNGFFKFFYAQNLDLNLASENSYYFSRHLSHNYWRLKYNCEICKHNPELQKRVLKEFYFWKKETISTADVLKLKDYQKERFYSSRIYNWIVNPFYKIHSLFFRNFMYPVIFLVMFILSMVGFVFSRFSSKLFLSIFLSSLILLFHNYLLSFHLTFIVVRYTYQVSFIYYLSIIFLPLMIESFWHYKKTGSFKY